MSLPSGRFAALLLVGVVVAAGAACKKGGATPKSYAASVYAGPVGRSLVFEPVSAHADSGADSGTSDTASADTGGADTAAADTAAPDTGGDTSGDTASVARLTIAIGDTAWTITLPSGPTDHPWSADNGLVVDDSTLLPPTVTKGAKADGVEVTDVGARTVWYGSFPDVGTTSVTSGSLAGEWAFARDIGPIAMHYGQTDWELVYYQ